MTEENTTEVQGTEQEANEATSNQNIIQVQNPTAEEMQELLANIKTNYNFKVDVKPISFRFKKTTDKETGIETVRHPVDLAIPVPSIEGIIEILEKGEKGLELLMEAVEKVVTDRARDLLYDDHKLTAATFPVDQLSWEAIAALPKSQRRGGGIPKETWEEFAKDYIAVMPGVTGKTVEQVTNAAKILQNKLQAVKTNEPVLNLLVEQLTIYAENSPNLEEYKECVEFLVNKADQFLNTSEEELLANL